MHIFKTLIIWLIIVIQPLYAENTINPAIFNVLSKQNVKLTSTSQSTHDANKFENKFTRIMGSYQKELKNNDKRITSYRNTTDIITSAANAILPPSNILTTFATGYLNKVVNSKITKFENNLKKQATLAVKTKLSDLNKNVKPSEWVNKHFKSELDKVSDDILPTINRYLVEAVENQIIELGEKQKSDINKLQEADKTLKADTIKNRNSIAALKTNNLQLQSNIEILSNGIQV